MRVVKLLKVELLVIANNDIEDFYVEDIIQLALEEELQRILEQQNEQPIRYVKIRVAESHPSVIVEDDYSIVQS